MGTFGTRSYSSKTLAALVLSVCLIGCQQPTANDLSNTVAGEFVEGGVPAIRLEPDAVTAKAREFFVDWLKGHGETEIISDDSGVGLANSDARLLAFLHGTESGENRTTAEIEFRVVLPDGREIQDFVAGMGEDFEQASGMAFLNYTLSTFHTIYSCFMNQDDPHMQHEEITINGNRMRYTTAGMFSLGNDQLDMSEVSGQIKQIIASIELPNKVCWLKFVHGESQGKPIVTSALVNNADHQQLTEMTKRLSWPSTDDFYLAKQFVIVRPVPKTKNGQ